jgi:8-oxo-dGTP pyrophosphatase MutT (NUDIX family)
MPRCRSVGLHHAVAGPEWNAIMWLFYPSVGFLSVVQKPGEAQLTVRARVAADLDRLRERYLPTLSATVANAGTDYPFRARASRKAFSEAMARMGENIDYANFKNEVAKVSGKGRAHIYSGVWTQLLALEGSEPAPAKRKPAVASPTPTGASFGGVLIDAEGRVLLREPSGHYGGYVWTFAKGGADPGETPEDAALREVREETGVEGEIICRLPGEFRGDTGVTVFYLMRPTLTGGKFGKETAVIRWVTPDEAAKLIEQTVSERGRKRDAQVLKAAFAAWKEQ